MHRIEDDHRGLVELGVRWANAPSGNGVMAGRRGSIQEYPDNPFNPGFGVAPPLLAGRQEILHTVLTGLSKGPGRHEFHSVVVGPRGTGKTVLLAEVERYVELERQSLVLRWSGTESLAQRIADQHAALEGRLSGATRRGLRRVDPDVSVKVAPAGIGVEARFGGRDSATHAQSVHSVLEQLGRAAARRHRTIVILADELQAASPDDMRQLGVSIQDVANVQRLPLALVGAGLPNTQHTFQRANVTFLERLRLAPIGLLNDGDTRDAIEIPIVDAGRRINATALDVLAKASGGYPYAIQLVASYCWDAAGQEGEINARHAHTAERKANDELRGGLFITSWQQVAPADRTYLIAAANTRNADGESRTADIGEFLGRAPSATTAMRDRLINRHALLYSPARGVVRFTLPGFADWVAHQPGRVPQNSSTSH
ncbi:MAG: ATP-binding protein [Ilumatobacteraceae bacterium]